MTIYIISHVAGKEEYEGCLSSKRLHVLSLRLNLEEGKKKEKLSVSCALVEKHHVIQHIHVLLSTATVKKRKYTLFLCVSCLMYMAALVSGGSSCSFLYFHRHDSVFSGPNAGKQRRGAVNQRRPTNKPCWY